MKKNLISFLGTILISGNLGTGCIAQTKGALEIFNDVYKIKYQTEKEGEDYWQTPKETRRLGTGDCEDMAFLLEDELIKNNHNAEVVYGVSSLTAKQMHAWVEYNIDDDKYIMDVTAGMIVERNILHPLNYLKIDKEILKDKIKEYRQRIDDGE